MKLIKSFVAELLCVSAVILPMNQQFTYIQPKATFQAPPAQTHTTIQANAQTINVPQPPVLRTHVVQEIPKLFNLIRDHANIRTQLDTTTKALQNILTSFDAMSIDGIENMSIELGSTSELNTAVQAELQELKEFIVRTVCRVENGRVIYGGLSANQTAELGRRVCDFLFRYYGKTQALKIIESMVNHGASYIETALRERTDKALVQSWFDWAAAGIHRTFNSHYATIVNHPSHRHAKELISLYKNGLGHIADTMADMNNSQIRTLIHELKRAYPQQASSSSSSSSSSMQTDRIAQTTDMVLTSANVDQFLQLSFQNLKNDTSITIDLRINRALELFREIKARGIELIPARQLELLSIFVDSFKEGINPITQSSNLISAASHLTYWIFFESGTYTHWTAEKLQKAHENTTSFYEILKTIDPRQFTADQYAKFAGSLVGNIVLGKGISKVVTILGEIGLATNTQQEISTLAGRIEETLTIATGKETVKTGAVNAEKIIQQNIINQVAQTNPNMLKPLGLGSTGRVIPVTLREQMVLKEILNNPALGGELLIKKGMTDLRWHQSNGWKKMFWHNAGVEIHYVAQWKNGILTAVDDFKFIITR